MIALTLAIAFFQQPADLPYRWVYVGTNLQVEKNADDVCALLVRAKKAGYTGLVLADSKFQRLGEVPDFYFKNAAKVVDSAKKNGMDVVPCVWPVGYASAMLGHDVNLIEGLPVRDAEFVVQSGLGQPVLRDKEFLGTGDMEQVTGDKVGGLSYQDGPGQCSFVDSQEKHEGHNSIRLEKFKQGNEAGNARLVWTIKTQPFHPCVLCGWYKTDGIKGLVQAIALDAKGRNLAITETSPAPTQGWTQFKFSFNSLESNEIKIYVGVWGGTAGRMWWDDISVREAGLLNVIRRKGCPLKVTASDGTPMDEGKDFEPVADPGLGAKPWAGEYDADHQAPAIQIKAGGRIKEGDHLRVSYYSAKTGIGNQTSICLSEPKTNEIMRDEAKRVAALFHPRGLFWSHDEIRIGGWCDACTSRHLTPGQILAENARTCGKLQQELLPGSETYVWSDMFDPSHNAVDGYYLTNGTLAGSWEGLPKQAIIVNWNSGSAARSLSFFAGRGHRQILAGYYDGPADQIQPWLREARKNKGLCGVMYTTWVGNYADLEAFAKAAWGGGGKP